MRQTHAQNGIAHAETQDIDSPYKCIEMMNFKPFDVKYNWQIFTLTADVFGSRENNTE